MFVWPDLGFILLLLSILVVIFTADEYQIKIKINNYLEIFNGF